MTTTATSPKPAPMALNADAIPPELRDKPRWVVWRWTWRDKKWTKPPLQVTGKKAKVNDPNTWTTFQSAVSALDQFDGIGFVLGDGIVGIDLDDCRDPATGEISEPAQSIISKTDSYAEVSPSAEGVKLLCRGTIPDGLAKVNHPMGIEVYDGGRYFCLTGHALPSMPTAIEERPAQISWLLTTYVAEKNKVMKTQSSDDIVVARAALAALNPSRADHYHDWLKTGMACHSVSDELLSDWDRWSRQSNKWAEGACADKWNSFCGNGIGIGSLVQWAKDDTGWTPPRASANGESKTQPKTEYKLTDLGNAQRLVAQHGKDMRYCHPWSKWLVWDGRRWKIDDTGAAERKAKETTKALWHEAAEQGEPDQRIALAKFAARSESSERIAAMLKLARSEPGIPILPDQMDQNPWIINVENGTLDLKTGELRNHRREDLLTKLAPVEYLPGWEAECPLWLAFLDKIFAENHELIGFVQRLFGYGILGLKQEHILPIFHGVGSNGKSTLLETIMAMLGKDYATKLDPDLLLQQKNQQHPTGKMDLFGKRLVFASETEDNARLKESLVKELTGADTIKGHRMREDNWEFSATHTMIMMTNHKPVVRGTDHAIWRRLRLVPFNVVIPDDEADKALPEKLKAEAAGILRWLVEGAQQWQQVGLDEPPDVIAATKQYRNSQDILGEFLGDRCDLGKDLAVPATQLYKTYSLWAEQNGEFRISQRRFGGAMTERGFDRYTNNGTWYRGIDVKTEATEATDNFSH